MTQTPREAAEAMREAGWSVAVHNDYRLGERSMTFWLWTHPNGRSVKGEGQTDDEALAPAAGSKHQVLITSSSSLLPLPRPNNIEYDIYVYPR